MFARSSIHSFARDTRGNMAMMTAVMMGVAILGVGAALDFTLMTNQSNDLQNMADAAVLAAARSGEEDNAKLQKIAQAVVDSHNLDGAELTVKARLDGDVVVVDISATHDLMMPGLMGSDPKPISVTSASPLPTSTPVNLALVLDTTGSMRGSNIAALKLASNALLTEMETAEAETKVSIVPFGQYVNIGFEEKNKDSRNWIDRGKEGQSWTSCWWQNGQQYCNTGTHRWRGCMGTHTDNAMASRAAVGSGRFPAALDVSCGSVVTPLSTDFTAMKTKINALTTGGTTYLAGGLAWGWRTLDKSAPYTEAAASTDPNLMSAMIFMTDGANNRSRGDSYWSSSGVKHNRGSDGGKAGLDLTKDLCRNIKASGVKIYVVAYKLPNAKSTADVLSECATSQDTFYEPESAAELIDTFKGIARNLNEARLVYHDGES
ncbi:MAG: TadE/TadG family type IV pilus assembly protein [Pseudomonadota bacterium]